MTVPVFANLGGGTPPDLNATVNIQNYSGSSWTPPSQGLLLSFVASSVSAGSPSIPAVGGNGLQWYRIQTMLYGTSSANRVTLFAANCTGSSAGVSTFSFAETQNCCRVSVMLVSGSTVDFSQGVTGTVVQVVTATVNGGTTGTVTLAAASHADNRPIFYATHMANEVTEPKSGWVEFDDFAGAAPTQGVETQVNRTTFDTVPNATWVTSALWAVMAAEIGVRSASNNYNDSVALSRLETVSDRPTVNILSNVTLAQKDGFIDGMGNSIPQSSALNKILSLTDLAGLGFYKEVSLHKDLSISDSATVNIFPSLALLQILASTSAVYANMQGSVGLSGDFGINGSPNNNVNPNASLLSRMGVSLNGGLSLLSNLTIAEKLGFSVLGNVQIYPSLTLGKDLAFVPANIALIGGSVSLGQELGLIDVPNLNAQAALSFLQSLGINLSSAISTNQVEALLTLAHDLGLSASAQIKSYPLVGLEKHLFLVDANNANMFGRNVLSEIRAINVLGGLALQSSVAIPVDLGILTGKLISVLKDVTISERLGISESVIANMQASVSLGEVAGMGNAVSQLLNAGLSINVIGSVLTIAGLDVIIVKGFVFTFDATKDSVSTQNYSKSVSTSESENYIP